MKLTKTDQQKWIENQLEFLRPLFGFILITYSGYMIAILSNDSHVLQLADFVPPRWVIGAIVLYCFNGLYDLGRKLQG